MYHPTDRIAHTTAFVTPVVEHWLEREIAQWANIQMKPTMNCTVVVLCYIKECCMWVWVVFVVRPPENCSSMPVLSTTFDFAKEFSSRHGNSS